MRILIPITTFTKSGGMRVLEILGTNWVDKGHEVTIVVADTSEPYFPTRAQIIRLNRKKNATKDEVQALTDFIRKRIDSYDIIIANGYVSAYPVFFSTFGRKRKKAVYYIQCYETDFHNELPNGLTKILKKIGTELTYYFPFKKIVNSDIYKNYRHIHTENVVYPGLDLSNYYSKDPESFNKTIKVGTIGRKESFKGTADVCRAMEILKEEGIRFEFYIAFNDFDTIYHSFVKPDGDENLASFYREMDIVVAACKGQSGAIHYPVIETMAVGTTIICTDYYPSNPSNSYKVEESAPEQIAEAVKHIIANKEEAIQKRRQALNDVQQFGWPIVAEKFMRYLQDNGGSFK